MKLSLSWIFDHIAADWHSINLDELVAQFNRKVAEIATIERVVCNPDVLWEASVKSFTDYEVIVQLSNKSLITLSYREGVQVGQWYIIKKNHEEYTWASTVNLGGDTDRLLPPVCIDSIPLWKNTVEREDYIITVDNTSITHRPDMWGHRGFAREIAALLNVSLKPLDCFLKPVNVAEYAQPQHIVTGNFIAEIMNDADCEACALGLIPLVQSKPSFLWMVHRLARVGMRPTNAIVDATNYAMLDLGNPMHAYDAQAVQGNRLYIRKACLNESVTLLDQTVITLDIQDTVVADSRAILSLGGIMGGSSSQITSFTDRVLIESAYFDPTSIRKTAERHKKRTEAAVRFEKNIDAQNCIPTLERFVFLLSEMGVVKNDPINIALYKKPYLPTTIVITHDFIEKKFGVSVSKEKIVTILRRLECKVEVDDNTYSVTVPSFRATKDLKIKEDILEEIIRFIGYDNLPYELPSFQVAPCDATALHRLRKIKYLMAYACRMQEVSNYAFFNEDFLRIVEWSPTQALEVVDPVSQQWKRLATSLIPNLLKNVIDNSPENEQLNFFEWARTWQLDSNKYLEQKTLSGIFFDKKSSLDFYQGKSHLELMMAEIGIVVEWHQIQTPKMPWFKPFQTASLIHNSQVMGMAGMANDGFLSKIIEGNAFIFELNGSYLIDAVIPVICYQPVSKYPTIERDISMFVPFSVSAQQLISALYQIDKRIIRVTLIDFFEKPEWKDKKSLSIRFTISDNTKTLVKEEIDHLYERICATVCGYGAQLR